MIARQLATAVLTFVVGCEASESRQAKELGPLEGATTASQPWVVPAEEVPHLRHKALSGDPDSAFRLSMHFEVVGSGDGALGFYWLNIAVENGSAQAIQNLALWLADYGGFEACSRAWQLVRRVASRREEEISAEERESLEDLLRQAERDRCKRAAPFPGTEAFNEPSTQQMRLQALQGDSAKARALASEAEGAEADSWWHIAAQNGDETVMIEYADWLVKRGRCERARFWLQRFQESKRDQSTSDRQRARALGGIIREGSQCRSNE